MRLLRDFRFVRAPLAAAAALAILGTAACSPDAGAPTAARPSAAAPALKDPANLLPAGTTLNNNGLANAFGQLANTPTTVTFTLNADPNGPRSFTAGTHLIVFGNGLASVCDPATSTYGITEWDKPCTPATHPIQFTATTWTAANGHPQIDFSPAVRFVPTNDPTKQVSIFLYDQAAANGSAPARIKYCPTKLGVCVDESVTDPSLTTYRWGGFLYRRVKHFSGYIIGMGLTDDGSDGSGMN